MKAALLFFFAPLLIFSGFLFTVFSFAALIALVNFEVPDRLPQALPGKYTPAENYENWRSICDFGRHGALITDEHRRICRTIP